MKKTTHTKLLILLILAVAAGIALLLPFYLRQTHVTGAEKRGSASESTPDQPSEPEMIAARPGPVLESPLLNDDSEAAEKAVKENHWFEKREDGVFTSIPFGNMENPGADISMIELRFLKKNENDELKKLYIEDLRAYQRVGQYTEDIAGKGWDGAAMYSVEANRLRVGACPPGTRFRCFGFGERYHLIYKAGETEFYESIIKIPDVIPAGKMAIIDVLAEISGGYSIPRRPPKPDTRIPIAGKITIPQPPTETEWMVAYNHADKNVSGFTNIKADGSFDLGQREPNGMLRIAERGRETVAWIIVDSVDKSPLTLPKDADRVIPRDSLLDIDVVLPKDPDIKTFSGIWVVDDKDGLGPIAAQARPSKYNPDQLKHFYESGLLRLKAPPGKYWVKAYYDPPREWIDLGWITVPDKEPSGTVPQLHPVLD